MSLDGRVSWSTQAQPADRGDTRCHRQPVPVSRLWCATGHPTLIVPSLPLRSGQDYREGPGCETGPIMPQTEAIPDVVYGRCKGQFERHELSDEADAGATGLARSRCTGMPPSRPDLPVPACVADGTFRRTIRTSCITDRSISIGRETTASRGRRSRPASDRADPAATAIPSGEPITRDVTGEEFYSTLYCDSRVAARARRHLDRVERWAGLRHARRREDVDERDAARSAARRARAEHRAVAASQASAYFAVYRYLLGDFAAVHL